MFNINNIHFNIKRNVEFFDIGIKTFTLEEDLPALLVGHEPIDTSDVGVTINI